MDDQTRQSIGIALGKIPSGVYVLCAQHEERRVGMLASWVQQVCFEPPMICIAIGKGRAVLPVLSESRRFALCQVGEGDQVLTRKFSGDHAATGDPFLGFELMSGRSSDLPILKQASSFLECELARHLDVEGDHDLFVGKVYNGGSNGQPPQVRLRDDGFSY